MSTLSIDGLVFQELAGQILKSGNRVRFKAKGCSMQPFIMDGDILVAAPDTGSPYYPGDVLLVQVSPDRSFAHRVIQARSFAGQWEYLIQGDAQQIPDGWFGRDKVLGYISAIEFEKTVISLFEQKQRLRAWIWVVIAPFAKKLPWFPTSIRRIIKQILLGNLLRNHSLSSRRPS